MAIQLLNPDLSQILDNGYCLRDVQNAYGVTHRYSTALECWNNQAPWNHANGHIPSGLFLPVFFGPANVNYQAGHVTVGRYSASGSGVEGYFRGNWYDVQNTSIWGSNYLGCSYTCNGKDLIAKEGPYTPPNNTSIENHFIQCGNGLYKDRNGNTIQMFNGGKEARFIKNG